MRIIAKRTLQKFWGKHGDSKESLLSWYEEVKKAHWDYPQDLLAKYPNVRTIPKDRAIFNIKGGRYRLVVAIDYFRKVVYIKFIGTHNDYDKINALEV
ncbi:MAG: toxin RelE [bacterium]|nr:MAG: toxin RelE [bacterium]